jgi:DNA primase
MDLVLPEGIPTSVIELPQGDDPDSFVTAQGAGAFTQRVSQARPIFEHYFRHLLATEDAGSVEGKRKILAELLPCLRKISDQIQRRLYLTEIARVLGMDAAELRNDAGLGGGAKTVAAPSRGAGSSGTDSAEMLLALMASYPELAARAVERGIARLLPVELAPVAEAIIAQSAKNDKIDLGALLEGMQEGGGHQHLAALFVNDAHLEDIDCQKAFDQCCAALERGALKDIKGLARELARTDEGSPRYGELMKEIETLRNIKSQLL